MELEPEEKGGRGLVGKTMNNSSRKDPERTGSSGGSGIDGKRGGVRRGVVGGKFGIN